MAEESEVLSGKYKVAKESVDLNDEKWQKVPKSQTPKPTADIENLTLARTAP